MITILVAFAAEGMTERDDFALYGALVERTVQETVGDPTALYVGQAEWVAGDVLPSGLLAVNNPNMAAIPDMVERLELLAAMFGQSAVAVSLANVEVIGSAAAYLSAPTVAESTVSADPWADEWSEDAEAFAALERELSSYYGDDTDDDLFITNDDDDVPFADVDEARAFLVSLFGAEGSAPEVE